MTEKLALHYRKALLCGVATEQDQATIAQYLAKIEAALIVASAMREKRKAWIMRRDKESSFAMIMAEKEFDTICRTRLEDIFSDWHERNNQPWDRTTEEEDCDYAGA